MNSYAPLFSEITDSSVWEEPYHVRLAWLTLMAKKKSDHVAYCDAYKLKKWANLGTLEEAEDALRVLSSPDRRKPGQEYEGRRIKAVEGGWLLLNGDYYEKMMRQISERVRKARWARENRNQTSGKPLPGEVAYEEAVNEGEDAKARELLDNQPH